MNQLAELFFSSEGKVSDKWEQFLAIYDLELKSFVDGNQPVRLLEIGVQNGGSLELWSAYLPPGSTIVGLDIDPAVEALRFEGDVRAHCVDVNDIRRIEEALGDQTFDIVIDDGSHRSSDIIAAFQILFSKIRPGGKYIVEDLHASYWASHEGGFRLASSAIEHFKNLVDALNADHFQPDPRLSDETRAQLTRANRHLARISFYDSVVVVEKLCAEKTIPFRRLFGGRKLGVMAPGFVVKHTAPSVLRDAFISRSAVHWLNEGLLDQVDHHRAHANKVEAQNRRQADAYDHKLKHLESELEALRADNAVLTRERDQSALSCAESERSAVAARGELDIVSQKLSEALDAVVQSNDAVVQSNLEKLRFESESEAHQRDIRSCHQRNEEVSAALAAAEERMSDTRQALLRELDRSNKARTRRLEIRSALDRAAQQARASDPREGKLASAERMRKLVKIFGPTRRITQGARDKQAADRGGERATIAAAPALFQAEWYRHQYPDVAAAGVDPLTDYLESGAGLARDPNPLFQSAWYLEEHPDVSAAGVNPLAHYILSGASEGRDPNPYFQSAWYLQNYPGVAEAGLNPLAHYIEVGAQEGRDPSPLFKSAWYLQQNPDVAAAGMNPLAHYLAYGEGEGRRPHPLLQG